MSRCEKMPASFGRCRGAGPRPALAFGLRNDLLRPEEMVVAPEVEVRANGKPAYALIGGSLGETLRFAGVRQQKDVLPRLVVLRPWNGMLLPVS